MSDCALAGKPASAQAPRMPGDAALVIETSTPSGSMLLAGPDGVIASRSFSSDRSHNAILFGPLDELMKLPGAGEIGLVLVGSGPGSYSGTRVGIAAAQGVAIARGCPAVAVPSVLALECEAGCVIGDARRGSYWLAKIRERRLVSEPTLTDAAGLAEAVAGEPLVVSFEEASRFSLEAETRQMFPTAEGLWQAWLAADEETRAAWSAAPPQPMYLKPPHITAAKRPWLIR